MTATTTADFRNRATGKVVKLPLGYAEESHPFYDQFEFLGEEYEWEKVVVEAVSDPDALPAGNASRDVWAEYASARELEIPDTMTRDEIKALFEETN